MKTRNLSYEKLRSHYPSLFVSYCLDDGRAAKFFGIRYRDEKAVLERARRAAEKGLEEPVLRNLRQYHLDCGAPREALAAVEKAGRGAAWVVTGQQPSVGMGPFYNFCKAQTALKIAQAIDARGVPCVAVFWNHSDDVRGGTSAAFPDRENRLKEISIAPGEPGTPLYEVSSPEELRMFATALAEALPRTEFTPWLEELLREAHRGNVAEAFARSLLSSLGQFGLIVVEPRHLEGPRVERFFAEHRANPQRLSDAVEAGRQDVVAEGFEDHLGRDVGLDLFDVRGARRVRLEPGDAPRGRLSAGVALRPLLQDAVLPTAAYVGGPSEVGYQAALPHAYRAFGIDPPAVYPRVTATLLEPKIDRLVEKYGLSTEDLFGPGEALAPKFGGPDRQVSEDLEKLPLRWKEELEGIVGELTAKPSVGTAMLRSLEKVADALRALRRRIEEELEREETTGAGQHRKLLTHLRPDGKLQERVFTPFYYFSLFGPEFPTKLVATLDPFVLAHQLITIA